MRSVNQNNDSGWTGAGMGDEIRYLVVYIVRATNLNVPLTTLNDPFIEPPIAYSAKLGELHPKKSFYN